MAKATPRQIKPRSIRTLEKIGSGQFACVYRGELLSDNVGAGGFNLSKPLPVAIKSMKADAAGEAEIKDFIAEAALMAQFNHSNILRLLGVSVDDTIKLVMELATKGSLQHLLQTTAVSQPMQLQMVIDVAAGMQYLENCGFIHRDLATRNVLVSETCVLSWVQMLFGNAIVLGCRLIM